MGDILDVLVAELEAQAAYNEQDHQAHIEAYWNQAF